MSIREAVPADVPAMLAIYAEYVTQTAVSFEYEVPSEAEFTRRLAEHRRLSLARLGGGRPRARLLLRRARL